MIYQPSPIDDFTLTVNRSLEPIIAAIYPEFDADMVFSVKIYFMDKFGRSKYNAWF